MGRCLGEDAGDNIEGQLNEGTEVWQPLTGNCHTSVPSFSGELNSSSPFFLLRRLLILLLCLLQLEVVGIIHV